MKKAGLQWPAWQNSKTSALRLLRSLFGLGRGFSTLEIRFAALALLSFVVLLAHSFFTLIC